MTIKWNPPETAPTDGKPFIYTNKIDGGIRDSLVSQCYWQDGDEDQNERFYDLDIGDEADIAGWIPRPTELVPIT